MITLQKGVDAVNQAVYTMHQFQTGKIKPITTGIPHLDEALMGGLIPGAVVSIIAASFQGKTYDIERIKRHIKKEVDPSGEEIVIIDCLWELEVLKVLSRDIAYSTKQDVRDVLFKEPTGQTADIFKAVTDSYRRPNMYFQPEPVSADQFEEDITYAMSTYPDKKIVVLIDNLENILVDNGKQKEAMDKMLYRINVLKKRHPFISFVILNQMNSDYEKRCHDLKHQRPKQSDIYQTGQLFKLSDVVVFKIMPTRFGIYDKFLIFGNSMYEHLEEHKIPSRAKTTSFDPFGRVFYFYLKARESSKDFQELKIEVMYTRKDVGAPPVQAISAPDLGKKDKDKKDEEQMIAPVDLTKISTLNDSSSKGEGFE